jgi:hypothetical protein
MPDETMWKEMLGTLKDISSYLEKQDELEKQITQDKAELAKTPKARETQAPITGQGSVVGRPETDKVITKEFISKNEADEEDSEASEAESETAEAEENSEETEELKSLLKDIRDALAAQSDVVKSEIKKALPEIVKKEVAKGIDNMLRKQGFAPTHPDVTRIGLDTTGEVKKSEDERVEGDIKKSEVKEENDLLTAIDKLSKNTSWQTLGQMREKAGLFRIF